MLFVSIFSSRYTESWPYLWSPEPAITYVVRTPLVLPQVNDPKSLGVLHRTENLNHDEVIILLTM